MNFLIYGESHRFGSGSWCYAESLREMGHLVVDFSEFTDLDAYRSRIPHRLYRRITRTPLEGDRLRHIASLTKALRDNRIDVCIIQKGLFLGAEDVAALRSSGAWVVNVNHDDFFSANPSNWSFLQRRAVSAYDYIFTTRQVNVGEVFPVNPRVEFFPFAYYPRIHHVVTPSPAEAEKWAADVVFVGTWERERCELLEDVAAHSSFSFAIYGSQWERIGQNSPLRKFVRGRPLSGDDMALAIGQAKVALAFLRKENRDDYTQRTFEIPACGGVLLAERTDRHRSYYREGLEAEFFDPNSSDELARKIQLLVNDGDYRENVRRAGLAALQRQRHTYVDRLKRLIEVYAQTRKA